MKIQKIPTNFIYPEINPTDFKVGSATELPIDPLRRSKDWRDYVPQPEDQVKYGVEPSDCYIQAQQHTNTTIEEEKYGEIDNNYSARFNALLSDGTPHGGDPIKGAYSIHNDGLVKEEDFPFTPDIQNWDEYHSWKGGHEPTLRRIGQMDTKKKERLYHIIFERDLPIEKKYARLKQELESCPPDVSVLGWYQDDNGVYIKPEGGVDNHFVELVYIDENNCPYIWDTYPPYLKKLEPFYNFDFSLGWRVNKVEPSNSTTDIGSVILNAIKRFFNWLLK